MEAAEAAAAKRRVAFAVFALRGIGAIGALRGLHRIQMSAKFVKHEPSNRTNTGARSDDLYSVCVFFKVVCLA